MSMRKGTIEKPLNHPIATLDGLSASQVTELRERFGENRLPPEKNVSSWTILINQFKSPLIYIILIAAGISLALGEISDFTIITFVVVADVIMGFVQEHKAQRTYIALKNLLKPIAIVIRGGQRQEVGVWELVPGDLVLISAGGKVPADSEIIEEIKLSLDEAILTGESEPVCKNVKEQVYMGTTAVTGRATLRVTSTGINTELGKIAASLGGDSEENTPLQSRLRIFSKTLTTVVVAFTLIILLSGIIMGREFFNMLRTSIVLAIAAVPEGLLIAVTVILVLGMRQILKRNGLVKRLLAVETLGSVTVICTDKTGTITEGRMRVDRVDLLDDKRAWQTMVLCNNLDGPVDISLWEYAEKQGPNSPQELIDSTKRLDEELFTSETKYMVTHVSGGIFNDKKYNFLKGAPEIVANMCNIPVKEKQHLLTKIEQWAGDGLRLIGLAYRLNDGGKTKNDYIWVGLVGIEDPVREGVAESIKLAQGAGIKVKMITGDYRKTAENIATNIGLMREGGEILEGEEITKLSDEQLKERMKETVVFSRVYPQDKYRIVNALRANGEIIAMIGDGVNDTPALKYADIGVVVGSATDVAKETADLILMDNKFDTIVSAIEEGRVIFTNIRKVVAYTLSNSFAEMLTIFFAMIFGWPAPLAVAQILWIHLICDGPSDIVLGFEPKEANLMEEGPNLLKAPILTPLASSLIVVISIVSSIFALAMFGYWYYIGDLAKGQSIVFASLAINSMVYIFAYRNMRLPIYKMNSLASNKYLIWAVAAGILTVLVAFWVPALRNLLGIVPLGIVEWLWVIGVACILLLIVEIAKIIANRLKIKN